MDRMPITAALASQLLDSGWTQERIDVAYVVDDSLVELERQERNERLLINRRGDYQKYQPNRAKRRKKR